jgi:ketosteroid isomerase-like protein
VATDNESIVRSVYERWSEGDFTTHDVYDPNVVLVMRPEFPDAGVYVGTEGIGRYTRGFLEPWSRITIEAEEIMLAGDSVVVAVKQRGTGTTSGAVTELRYFHVWSFRGGKAIRIESVRERGEALAAVGLRDYT